MPPEISQIEEERVGRLNQARKAAKLAKDIVGASHANPRAILSLSRKFGKYWPILVLAAIFDLFALIPLVSVIVNFFFGIVLYFYFGSKSKNKKVFESLLYIFIPIIFGSALDWFFSIIPVNLFAALSRMALKEIG